MHINTHYASNLENQCEFSPLIEHVATQTCIIGAGFAGLTTARELARKGHDVVLLEAELVGWGASGRNAGFVSAGFARSVSSIADKVGWDNTKELYQQSERGRDYIGKTISELGVDNVRLGNGWLNLLRHDKVKQLLDIRDMMEARLGVELDFVNGDDLKSLVLSESYYAGLYDPLAFHIQPLQYAGVLANDLQDLGGRIFERSSCSGIQYQTGIGGSRWRIAAGNGTVSADNVVLCTSAYGGPIAKLNSSMIPISTYVVSSAPCAALLNEFIPFKGCIADMRRAGDYYRTIGQGEQRRLIWGGRITTMRSQPERLALMLKKDITRVYPQLKSIKIERSWSGLMGYANHKMPIIANLDNGLWVATAFGGQGLNTSAMAGLLVSEAIFENDNQYRIFSPFAMQWSGGIIGRLAVQLEYWRLQFLDRRDERCSRTR